ncbi:type VI secretion system Vgr family protein [Pseudomonas aeruginosa]|uniref:type VI secretion system Vgr family protein n=1 Tax=Pseudomonas aeruginosa TaxID=287 RepID=UPI0030F40E47
MLSTIKSKEYKGSRANELRIDDTTAQISAALMSDHGASALHLGYLTHPRPEGARSTRAVGPTSCASTTPRRRSVRR